MQRRRVGLLLVVLAVFGLVLWSADHTEVEPDPDAATPSADPRVPERTTAPRARHRTAAALASDTGADVPIGEPDGSPLFPELVVEVSDHDGRPLRGGRVWAERSVDFAMGWRVAQADVDATGTCKLRLPKPDTYDVYASDGDMLGAIETGVDTRTTSHVKLALPQPVDVRLVRGDDEAPLEGNATISARRLSSGLLQESDMASMFIEDRRISLADLPLTLRTLPNTRFRYWRGIDPSVATPEAFTAPATIVIGRPKWGSCRFVVSVEPADRSASCESFVAWQFEIEGGGRVDRWNGLGGTMAIPAGARVSDIVRFTFHQSPPARHSFVTWSGRGFRAGSATIDVGESGVVVVPVVLRLDDGPLPTSEFVACVDGPAGTRAEVWIVGEEGNADSVPGIEELGRDQTIGFPPGWTPNALVAAAPGLVAEPQHLRIGERHAFRLVPGGFLRILRGVRPPEDVELRVRRKDRLPLRSDAAAFGKRGSMADVALDGPAVVVGPFVPGDVDLVVVCGTTILAEVTAHVVAGETTDVSLPLAERLPER